MLPDLFPPASLADAAVGGQMGARIAALTEAQRRFGLQPDDVVLAVGGKALGAASWEPLAADTLTLTVWRRQSGSRPVLEPAVLGRRVLHEFVALPEVERTPMRLALMLANQETLVREGGGVRLVPGNDRYDDALWLRVANPMPAASEAALREVVEALLGRAHLPAADDGEARRASEALRQGKFLEARERAARAMARCALEPPARGGRAALDTVTAVYVRAAAEESRQRALLLVPERRLAFVLEGQVGHIQSFLPQKTLFEVAGSRGAAFAVGVRVRAPLDAASFRRDQWPANNLELFLEYGQVRNRFEDVSSKPQLETLLQTVTAEIAYRPRLATRLEPFLRGGIGLYPLRVRVHLDDGSQATAISITKLGWTLGGGIDCVKWQAAHLRASVVGSYRVLVYRFNLPPLWDEAANYRRLHPNLELERGFVELDMSGWQAGIMLRFAR